MKRSTTVGLGGLVLLGLSGTSLPAYAGPAPGTALAQVTISAPVGVPANVRLTGRTVAIAAKPPSTTSTVVTLPLATGTYHVDVPDVTFNGTRYVGSASRPDVILGPGDKPSVQVSYQADGGATALHLTKTGQTSMSFVWSAAAGARFSLRRRSGKTPPASRNDGTDVPVVGNTALDQGLQPGTQHSYSLFTQDHSRWYGPLSVATSTASAAGSTQAAYVAAPTTLLAQPGDVLSTSTTGNGVQLTLQAALPTPLPGSAIVLPISATLPGGYLGVVDPLSMDGHTAGLVGGSLRDAFDYYDLAVDNFDVAVDGSTSGGTAGKALNGIAPNTVAPAPQGLAAGCGGGSATAAITFSPSVALGGHFDTKLDKYTVFGVDVAVGATVDMAITAKVTGAVAVKTSGNYKCNISIAKLFKTLTLTPVPISIMLTPTAQVTVGGAYEVSNMGLTASAGFSMAGTLSAKSGASSDGNAVLSAAPLDPKVTANGSVALKVGGELILGPGAGTADAGVIAGVSGELYPVDASFEPFFQAQDSRFNLCTVTKVAFTRGLNLIAKAWIGTWSFSEKITLSALQGTTPYFGSPWYLLNQCDQLQGAGAPDSLLGPGVTKTSESSTGSPDQAGFVPGFAPGKKTWVLSTGRISDATGQPSTFASSQLGLPGDSDLSALSGAPTYDAASYEVTVVPAGPRLHVRYVFASEEYPEFVGSQYNDVMAVCVNGQNCALVPGTNNPVSINTINDHTNASYYVDNATGAAGYSTSMDGLTVPLTCNLPVTPGQPVTIRIAVADAGDYAYDSAVALIDGGIFSD